MKIHLKKFVLGQVTLMFALACFALAPLIHAQCPQICDDNMNTALGDDALVNNTSGTGDTAIGASALTSNTTAFSNTATGSRALLSNTIGSENTAIGESALASNINGGDNTASGHSALQFNTSGNLNTAVGADALVFNTTGSFNTANGVDALSSNTTGSRNVAEGIDALTNNTTGSGNIALGEGAGKNLTIGDHNIDTGNRGIVAEANTIRIGRIGTQTGAFIAGISGAMVPAGVGVIVGTNGQLGTIVSSARFKDDIKPMEKASEAVLALQPVTFQYKKELDPEGIPQFGLVAEEVEKVNPDLVARDDQGKPYTVRYEAVNAMLLNEFLKEHRKVEQLEKQVAALTTGLQQMSAQLAAGQVRVAAATGFELSGSRPRMPLSSQ